MKVLVVLTLFLATVGAIGCSKEGCTNFAAANYDASATEDDGSCRFEGCTDPDAQNYDARAETDDGSCLYLSQVYIYASRSIPFDHAIEIYWNDGYAGRLRLTCTSDGAACEDTSCDLVKILDVEPGTYRYRSVYGRLGGAQSFVPKDTLADVAITVGATQCNPIWVE